MFNALYTLILVFATTSSNGGVAAVTVDMPDKHSCEVAQKVALDKSKALRGNTIFANNPIGITIVYYVCLPRNS